MLNLKGAFVVFGGAMAPKPVLLGAGAYSIYLERIRIADATKAAKATFGNDAEYALPCTVECMEYMALNYTGPHADALKALCACIVLGRPFNPDAKDYGEGGTAVKQETKPKKPRPGGAMAALDYAERNGGAAVALPVAAAIGGPA